LKTRAQKRKTKFGARCGGKGKGVPEKKKKVYLEGMGEESHGISQTVLAGSHLGSAGEGGKLVGEGSQKKKKKEGQGKRTTTKGEKVTKGKEWAVSRGGKKRERRGWTEVVK